MPSFSERYGYIVKTIQSESMSDTLRNRIWNVYRNKLTLNASGYDSAHLEKILDCFGLAIVKDNGYHSQKKNLETFHDWFINAKWFQIYDFIEAYISFLSQKDKKEVSNTFNIVLSEENSGYRVINYMVVPITNRTELSNIEKAQKSPFESVSRHIQKATELLSRRPNPDYENSIKESISAVEAMCCIISGKSGSGATLGKTIKKLKDNGIYIHSALENAFSSLYGYTSDEDGIRHGGIDFKKAPAEDAKYMLVSCSAFVNYLIEKWRIINQ